jgi:hypothetical protein
MSSEAKKKMKSRKFWFVIWAVIIATYIIVYSIHTGFDASWMPGTLALLVAIPTSYVAIGSSKKKKEE